MKQEKKNPGFGEPGRGNGARSVGAGGNNAGASTAQGAYTAGRARAVGLPTSPGQTVDHGPRQRRQSAGSSSLLDLALIGTRTPGYELPYAILHLDDGTDVLFDRGYIAILERKDGVVKHARGRKWVKNANAEWIYDASDNPPYEKGHLAAITRRRCEAILHEWRSALITDA